MLITFVLMLGLAAVARPMILSLIGEIWEPSIIYLQLLCFGGMFYPLHAINLNMLNVVGRSDIYLKLEIIKKLLIIPTIVMGILFGIKIMLAGMILNNIIAYYLNSYWSGKFINYSTKEQVKDIAPSFLLAACMALIVYIIGHFLTTPYLLTLIVQVTAGAVFVFVICELTKMPDYMYLRQIVFEKVFRRK